MAKRDEIINNYDVAVATIANGASVSDGVALGGMRLFGLITPDLLTGTVFTFQASVDGVNYKPIHDKSGVADSVTVAAGRHVPLDPAFYAGIPFIMVVSNANETAERSIQLVLRGI